MTDTRHAGDVPTTRLPSVPRTPPSPPAPRTRDPRTTRLAWIALVAVLVAVGGTLIGQQGPAVPTIRALAPATSPDGSGFRFVRLPDPARTVAVDAAGTPVATFTDGARTAALAGPTRTFAEPGATRAAVVSNTWVRLLPRPWQAGDETGSSFASWFDEARADPAPDVLAVAMQYTEGAAALGGPGGLRVGGDAGFGPPTETTRDENSDFYDYLGVPWRFRDGRAERPEPVRAGDVDCSGYVRLVWGYRMGIPLRGTDAPGPGLPRRARAIAEVGPGTVVVADRDRTAAEYGRLQPGDLVFFNIDPAVDPRIDHVGIYLGVDDRGGHRFLSSRAKADGPTLGDLGGTSLLDDGGYYSRAFRAVRRL